MSNEQKRAADIAHLAKLATEAAFERGFVAGWEARGKLEDERKERDRAERHRQVCENLEAGQASAQNWQQITEGRT